MDNPSYSSSTSSLGEFPVEQSTPQKPSALSNLLENVDESQQMATARSRAEYAHQNKLVAVRLGVASALFSALRLKHPPTAAHCLRVALNCSAWGLSVEITDEERDEIEVAALLHDVGKIGVPDRILQKCGKLTEDEYSLIEHHRQNGLAILSCCSDSKTLLEIVRYTGGWFNGAREGFDRAGMDLPLGSRLLSIVDAFDSMTTDHVYRKALSRDRAMNELFEGAGTQFDPELIQQFAALLSSESVGFNERVSRRWLHELYPEATNALWCSGNVTAAATQLPSINSLFHHKLLDSMHDAVVFIDSDRRIFLWNRAAERLTGATNSQVCDGAWTPEIIGLRDEMGRYLTEENCPVLTCLGNGQQSLRRLSIRARENKEMSVDAHISPVVGRDGIVHGVTLVLHDASPEVDLQERVEKLADKATRDPLTGVANRAQFDDALAELVETGLQRGVASSLIICDIDFFKKINDTYGHQAGDDALVSFAALLTRFCRPGDLVARYGGEEFIMLCMECENASATSKAEELRRELAGTPLPMLAGKCITASFGVTELQEGDTPETMLRRADRALMQAKDLGRNTVVQLGAGMAGEPTPQQTTGWFNWFKSSSPDQLLERKLITAVPIGVVVEKLRGFVADHHAQIVSIEEDNISLKIEGHGQQQSRRNDDRPVPFSIELSFEETEIPSPGRIGPMSRTLILVSIRPIRHRDRRRSNALERARQLLSSLRSYLVAQDYLPPPPVDNK
ncbi:diguanylate cyclase [Lignipirellula cremea]|uniref:diguanylate cyclase n=1 Tax=Lignipirellula cremea TaxID=2528010 RepID=A0A518E160_9BACT|nr:diguanylate cyclase [Lignipirellula cremea]QDU97812.1 Response regulator PleD [Lignipirellula cremea]